MSYLSNYVKILIFIFVFFSPDSDKIELILEEISALSKKEIFKVKKNLDTIYGSTSEAKINGLNQLHEQLKLHVNVSYLIHIRSIYYYLFSVSNLFVPINLLNCFYVSVFL